MVQMKPVIEMTARVTMDVIVIMDWLRADSFTLRQLIAVKKPVELNISALNIFYTQIAVYLFCT